jgi:protein-disulfide isomerase-like protein with CxxC motif
MGNEQRAAKNSLKDAELLATAISSTVKSDFKREFKIFETNLTARVENAENAIMDAARTREAIIAGVITMRRQLDKAQRKFARNNNSAELKEVLLEITEGISRLKMANEKVAEALSVVSKPPFSAVDLVEKFTLAMQVNSAGWESDARNLDDNLFELSNGSSPSEMDDLQNYIVTQGYDVLIAGDDRTSKGIRAAKEKLGIQSSSSDESE